MLVGTGSDRMQEHGLSFEAATELTASSSVFTTHTPVPAGNDRFPPELMQKYFEGYAAKLGLAFKVFMNFNARGAKVFERVTEENIKKRLAIVLDGKCYSAPVIQDKIPGGRAQITGSFTQDEARDLAIVLRAGALPAPVSVLEQRTVGPTLGQESIDSGMMATLIAAAAIIVFMAVYYGVAGLFANIVLILNIVLTMAGLAAFGATLTLPGIAGIILTIAMAVDANVLIYERIREELRLGLKPADAVHKGYDLATLAIVDSNTTNVLVAIILYQFGTGPIRGFAVTMESAFDELGLTFRPLAGVDDHDALRRQFRIFLSRHLGAGKNWTAPVVRELVERLYAEHDWVVPEPESSASRLLCSVADDIYI